MNSDVNPAYFYASKEIEWDMGHRVPNHDSKCKNPHGHRYRLRATVRGPLVDTFGSSSEGMVIDFGDLKKVMTEKIHDLLDHGTLIFVEDYPMQDAFEVEHSDVMDMVGTVRFGVMGNRPNPNGWQIHLATFIPTAENLAAFCYYYIEEELRKTSPGLELSRVELWETPTSLASFSGGK